MAAGHEAEAPVNPILRALYVDIDELDDGAAAYTCQMVVMGMIEGVLVQPCRVVAAGFPGQARIRQQLDGAEHGGLTYARIDALGSLEHRLGADVRLEAQKGLQHGPSGMRHLEPASLQISLKSRAFIVIHHNLHRGQQATVSITIIDTADRCQGHHFTFEPCTEYTR